MAVESVRARDFWQQLENQKTGSDEPDYFKRGSTFRNSYNAGGTSLSSVKTAGDNGTLHGPVWASIYCTSGRSADCFPIGRVWKTFRRFNINIPCGLLAASVNVIWGDAGIVKLPEMCKQTLWLTSEGERTTYRLEHTHVFTVRDRTRSRGIRSSSATSHRGVIRKLTPTVYKSTTSINQQQSTPSPGRTQKPIKMAENDVVLTTKRTEPGYIAPKRYETTCYFMPLAVPVWYSTSVSIKINSTKRTYKESVNYQKKLIPYRYIESMTTKTPSTPEPVMYVADLNIQREVPTVHYMSLEAQQEAALNQPFSTNHQINIESNT